MRALLLALLFSLAVPATRRAGPAGPHGTGKVFLTVEEALALAFPECRVERETRYLSAEEGRRAAQLARVELDARVVRPYVATRAGNLVGTAYFEVHRVRTKNEALMFVVGPDERLVRVEVLSFAEPLEYLPRASFYAQLVGRRLDEELDEKRGVRGVAGATLSTRSALEAARRVLAQHRVLSERRASPPVPSAAPDSARR